MEIPKQGQRGPEVTKLQNRLVELGYLDKNKLAGGAKPFGPSTIKAVKAWQSEHHVDGTLDESEVQALYANLDSNHNTNRDVSDYARVCQSLEEAIDRYGKPWDDRDAFWSKWGAACKLPQELKRLTKRGVIWVNKDLVNPLEDAFEEICDLGLARHVHTFDGCFNIRKVRGSTSNWSTHTFGIAIDLNAATNGLGVEPQIHSGIVECLVKRGFQWGGKFRRKDGMHFQRIRGF
jgi:hypothetical protein